ncbi:MAG: hypothetical protein D6755_02465 [Anaerolineae bacterium]|nr:MAG: hypothetical protein D6755_02465 [Anaerolineae bacterium]
MLPEDFPHLMNAAGFGGWVCPPAWETTLDAFITNPLTLQARSPAHPPRSARDEGLLLLHTGHPNPGLPAALQRYASVWMRSSVPVWVHLLADEHLPEVLDRLEEAGCAAGVEIRLPPGCDAQTARHITRTAWRGTPLMVQIPLTQARELADSVCSEAEAIISLGAPRGTLRASDASMLHGRVYAPALYPLVLETTLALAQAGIPVVACGAHTPAQVDALLQAGALGVQLDIPLWSDLTFPAGW